MILISVAACSSSENSSASQSAAKVADTAMITPANGVAKAAPDKGITVTAKSGVLAQVSVQGSGKAVDGTLSPDKKTWHSTWTLKPGTSYAVTATEQNPDGKTTTASSRFTTLKPSKTIRVSDVTPQPGETVGIGMPIMVNFSRPVTKRAAVEQALEVKSSTPVEGAWRWISSEEVMFRTKSYWPTHTKISLVAHLSGVYAAAGVYGTKDTTRSFTVGASHIMRVNLKTDEEKVYVNGKHTKTIAVSGGMGGSDSHGNDFRTTSGIHLAMGKAPSVVMTSPNIQPGEAGYYKEVVYKDVRISNSGEFLHQSPGAFECLGNRNCSHGCVRQSVSGAKYIFDLAQRGDIVDITGSTRKLEWNNGWGFWQLSWKQWRKGSALKQPVVTTTPLTAASSSATPAPVSN